MLWKERDREVYENLVGFPTSASKVIFTLYRRQVCLKGGAMLLLIIVRCIFFQWLDRPLGAYAASFFRGFTITLRHTTVGRTPLDE